MPSIEIERLRCLGLMIGSTNVCILSLGQRSSPGEIATFHELIDRLHQRNDQVVDGNGCHDDANDHVLAGIRTFPEIERLLPCSNRSDCSGNAYSQETNASHDHVNDLVEERMLTLGKECSTPRGIDATNRILNDQVHQTDDQFHLPDARNERPYHFAQESVFRRKKVSLCIKHSMLRLMIPMISRSKVMLAIIPAMVSGMALTLLAKA